MKKAVLREYLKNREKKAVVEETKPVEKPKRKAKKGDKQWKQYY